MSAVRTAHDALGATVLTVIQAQIQAALRTILIGDSVRASALTGAIPDSSIPTSITDGFDALTAALAAHASADPIDHPDGSITLEKLAFALVTAFTDLADVPHGYTSHAGHVVVVNTTEDGLTFTATPPGSADTFTDLTDTPANYSGAGLKQVRVNSGATGLEFVTPTLGLASDFPDDYSGQGTKVLRVNSAATAIEFIALALTHLVDFPGNYTAQGGKYVRVKSTEDGVEFTTPPGSSINVREQDSSPDLSGISTLVVDNGTLTDLGGGEARLTFSSGQAPDTAAYVIGDSTAPGGLTNAVVVPAYAAHPDRIPASPDSHDDEFDAGSLDSKWSWINQGGATATLAGSHLALTAPAASGDSARIIQQSISGGTWTVTAKLNLLATYTNYTQGGLIVRDSADGKLIFWELAYNNGLKLIAAHFTDATTYQSTAFENTFLTPTCYMRLVLNWTTIKYHWSLDGHHYYEAYTENASSWFSHQPTHIGLYANANNGSYPSLLTVDWFRVT